MATHEPRLLEVHEVAYQLKSSQETVLRLIRKRKLAAIRLGTRSWRVDPEDLRAFLDAQRVAADQARREATVHALQQARPA
jgi:excisionase family DNA binding protein